MYSSRTTVPSSPARREEAGYSGFVGGRRGSALGAVEGFAGAFGAIGGCAAGLTVVVWVIAVAGGVSIGMSMATSGGGTNGGGVSIFGGGGGGGSSTCGASSIMRVSIGPSTACTTRWDRPEFKAQPIA